MNAQASPELIAALYAAYERCTGMPIQRNSGRDMEWAHWLKWQYRDVEGNQRRFDESCIAEVVAHLRKTVTNESILGVMLRFSRLIGQPDTFEETLQQARAMKRNFRAPPTPKQQALAFAGRTEHDLKQPIKPPPPKKEWRSAAEIMATPEFLRFQALRIKLERGEDIRPEDYEPNA